MCTKFDDFRFTRSSHMFKAEKFCNGSHDLTTPHHRQFVVRRLKAVTYTFNLYIKFVVLAIANYEGTLGDARCRN